MRPVAGGVLLLLLAGAGQPAPARSSAVGREPISAPVSGETLPLHDGWRIQSSALVGKNGAKISSSPYVPSGWHKATVPNTVAGALVEDGTYEDPFFGMNLRKLPGMTYPIGKLFVHLPMDPGSPFAVPWWYRTTFRLPASFDGRRVTLHFNGINYRANIWLNGRRLRDSTQIQGAFRRYELDITDAVKRTGSNVLAVEVFAPTTADLATNSVDWNPSPPDKMMGLWHRVYLSASGDVVVRYPQVVSQIDPGLKRADLTVGALLRNLSAHPVSGVLRGHIGKLAFQKKLTLAAHDSADVRFTPDSFPQLRINKPQLWWPVELGKPTLHTLQLEFVERPAPGSRTRAPRDGVVSDRQSVRFGIRQITSELTPTGGLLFRVNGRRILIRGAGWASDLFFRPQPQRQLDQLRYALDMHLNTIRLEGKLENDLFWQRADSLGILVMPGWCCCSVWEEWKRWGPEQYRVAAASQRDQIFRLRAHASALVWLNGSDNPPPADVEKMYLAIEAREHWPNPIVSSASARPTTVTGPSGVKMNGPYYWVPPSYWLLDKTHGGAWGYATEVGPGAAVPPMESVRRMLPARDLWPLDSVWRFHINGGHSEGGRHFLDALDARYGRPSGVEDFTEKAQLMTYEGERAMFEGYRRNKYVATGVIQWMLDNAWPGINWHLFDWYLRPGGGYFGAKAANEPVHVMYSYDDRSIVVVNGRRAPVPGVHLRARILAVDASSKFEKDTVLDVPADSSLRVFTLPRPAGVSGVYFVDLRLAGADGRPLSTNFYWLSTRPDVPELDRSTSFVTPVKSYADYTGLARLPSQPVTAVVHFTPTPDGQVARVTLTNPGKGLAFFVRLQVRAGADGDEVLPVEWSDNYISLLPGETRRLTATYRSRDFHGREPVLTVSGWNVPPVTVSANGRVVSR